MNRGSVGTSKRQVYKEEERVNRAVMPVFF